MVSWASPIPRNLERKLASSVLARMIPCCNSGMMHGATELGQPRETVEKGRSHPQGPRSGRSPAIKSLQGMNHWIGLSLIFLNHWINGQSLAIIGLSNSSLFPREFGRLWDTTTKSLRQALRSFWWLSNSWAKSMADRSWDHGVTARNETQKLAETPADSDITKSQKKTRKRP